jgi:DNA-binding CsgD family transcriptional regulator
MVIKKKLKALTNKAFIVLSMLWMVLFVWYGPKLGILSINGQFKLELQNVYIVVYGICGLLFTFLCKAENYIVVAKLGIIGTFAGFIIVVTNRLSFLALTGVLIMAVFSAAFTLSIFYLFLYELTSREQEQVTVYIIAINAIMQFASSLGLSRIKDHAFNALSFILLISIFICTTKLEKVNYNIKYEAKYKHVPVISLYGAFLIVFAVQFLNGVAVIVLHYKSFNESGSYLFFYAGQFLAAVMAYILIVKMSLKIMDLFSIYFFSAICGFVLIMISKSAGFNFIDIGIIFLGYCEIGTILEWLITASICRKYRSIWVLRGFLFAFALSSAAVAAAGSFLVNQTENLFYILATAVSLLFVSVIFMFIPLFNRLHMELLQEDELSLENDILSGGKGKVTLPKQKESIEIDCLDVLTKREIEITRLLLEGYTAPQIADILKIKLNTTKVHIRNAYDKLEVNSRPELFIRYGDKI